MYSFNPLVMNGFSHSYHLDESTLIDRGFWSDFSFSFHFSMKILKANGIAQDGTPLFAASHLGLFCLPMSHKKDARLFWVEGQCEFVFQGELTIKVKEMFAVDLWLMIVLMTLMHY